MTNQIQNSNDKKIRINKFLAQAGFGSRRGVEDIIKSGRVKVNHKIAKLSDKINSSTDIVKVDNKIIKPKKEFIYYAVNKPVGYTSSVSDIHAEKLVTSLVPKEPRVFPVGRLDKDSCGLIVLTNDGDLANKLTHPRHKHEKEYEVKLKVQSLKFKAKSQNLKQLIQKLQNGVKLEEGVAKADKIKIVELDEKRKIAIINIVLHQGWKRQIRRMCERLGLVVLQLKRIRIGKLLLGDLKEGEYKLIERRDII